MFISPGRPGRLETKPARAASRIPICIRLPAWGSRSDTDAINRRLVWGLLQSRKIIRYISDIPCDIIQSLENDAEEGQNFIEDLKDVIEDLKDGKVPTIIQDLPSEVIGAFTDVVGIFETLPTKIVGAAEAAVTDAVQCL